MNEAPWQRDPIADDQMVALALAKLAIERPGWRWTLRGLAEERGFLEGFDAMYKLHNERSHGAWQGR